RRCSLRLTSSSIVGNAANRSRAFVIGTLLSRMSFATWRCRLPPLVARRPECRRRSGRLARRAFPRGSPHVLLEQITDHFACWLTLGKRPASPVREVIHPA